MSGVIIGLFASYCLTRFLASQIWSILVTDPWTFGAVALLAIFHRPHRMPASRAARAFFHMKNYHEALDALENAMRCPEAVGNPYLHLRLGQVAFELGDQERASDELGRAYMAGSEEIFAGEDSRYLAFVKSKLRPHTVTR